MSPISKLIFIIVLTATSGSFALSAYNNEEKQRINTHKVKVTKNLAKIGRKAARKGVPILLEFAATDCGYCVLLENEILNPMLLSGDYDNKVIIRKVYIDEGETIVKDFNGRKTTLNKIVLRYNIFVTPTIVFIDHTGKELSKRLIGINTVEYFGGDVDNAIRESLKKIKKSQYSDSDDE